MESSLASTNQCVNPKLYTQILCARCDAKETFEFDSQSVAKIGHLLSLSFSSNDRGLVNDFHVCNPENPNNMVDIAGVITYAGWDINDNFSISFRLSPQNRAIFHEILCTSPEGLELAVELVIYDYDYHEKKYFQRFHIKKPVYFEITSMVAINDEPDRILRKPVVFECGMGLKPSKNVLDQEICFATSASGRTYKRNLNPPASNVSAK